MKVDADDGLPIEPGDALLLLGGDALPPTRSAALARIARVRPAAYARTRNHLDGAVTGLSPYLTHGLVSLHEVLSGVLAAHGPGLDVQHKLVFELGWRAYFRHVWAHRGDGILQSLHQGPRPEGESTRTLPDDIRQGRTGVPVIDQAVRVLYATGTLHNHARMWLASYVVHLRQVHWRAGADWMVAHLLDGDLASNHLSWQWVAGTGSHKPYLFNADNVARYAPPAWHSPGTVVDQSYEALDRIARGEARAASGGRSSGRPDGRSDDRPADRLSAASARQPALPATPEPLLHDAPPDALGVSTLRGDGPDRSALADRLRGRAVWLVHPWALRDPAHDLAALGRVPGTEAGTIDGPPNDPVVIGVYPLEHHAVWPWPEARWRWVDAAMAAVAPQRWALDAASLGAVLSQATSVHAVDDPHVNGWLRAAAGDRLRLSAAPSLFPPVDRRCDSFSQWWTRATRGLKLAQELL